MVHLLVEMVQYHFNIFKITKKIKILTNFFKDINGIKT